MSSSGDKTPTPASPTTATPNAVTPIPASAEIGKNADDAQGAVPSSFAAAAKKGLGNAGAYASSLNASYLVTLTPVSSTESFWTDAKRGSMRQVSLLRWAAALVSDRPTVRFAKAKAELAFTQRSFAERVLAEALSLTIDGDKIEAYSKDAEAPTVAFRVYGLPFGVTLRHLREAAVPLGQVKRVFQATIKDDKGVILAYTTSATIVVVPNPDLQPRSVLVVAGRNCTLVDPRAPRRNVRRRTDEPEIDDASKASAASASSTPAPAAAPASTTPAPSAEAAASGTATAEQDDGFTTVQRKKDRESADARAQREASAASATAAKAAEQEKTKTKKAERDAIKKTAAAAAAKKKQADEPVVPEEDRQHLKERTNGSFQLPPPLTMPQRDHSEQQSQQTVQRPPTPRQASPVVVVDKPLRKAVASDGEEERVHKEAGASMETDSAGGIAGGVAAERTEA
jgi:hypothetical protein